MISKRFAQNVASLAAVAAVAVPSAASAAKPTIERETVNETFVDEFLSEACGTTVTTTAKGHVTIRVFDREKGLVELVTINVGLTARAGDNVVRFRDVGSDAVRITPDGTAILRIAGQVPFEFKGTLKINLDTGEAILEPRATGAQQLARVCAKLTQ